MEEGFVSIQSSRDPLKEIQRNHSESLPKDGALHKKHLEREKCEGEDLGTAKDDQIRFNKLVIKAKELTGQGKIGEALEKNKAALEICYSEKLARKVERMEAYLKELEEEEGEEEEEEEDTGMVHVGEGFHLYKDLYNKLYPHQKESVLWMWKLYKKRKGGILGDDMGLGKTIQVIAFLSGIFDAEKVHAVMLVLPVALICNWEKEFEKWTPGIRVEVFHAGSKKDRERSLMKVQRRGGVCLTSYGMVANNHEILTHTVDTAREFTWDYVILDEGHKIKNPTKTSKGVHAVAAKNRLVLTGTPIQNNLRELWALFDFVHFGSLLGTARTFKMEFDTPITRSREKDATAGERRLGQEMAESLKRIIAPYFLRRTKAEVEKKKAQAEGNDTNERVLQMPTLTRKNDLIVWLHLSEAQQSIYKDFLETNDVKELLMTNKSPLVQLTVLKKICDHPRLLSTLACSKLGLNAHEETEVDENDADAYETAINKIDQLSDEVLMNESGKVMVVMDLVQNLRESGHRCLIFSQSRKMLDIMQRILTNRGHKIMRLDGTIRHLDEREKRINKFQSDSSYNVFLLTTQVGGVGLTLTAADRVIIYDPSWNPATDAQAVDRAFRIGQEKNVVIYRLITCGTVEEKIYRRQIFKDSIFRQTTGNAKNPFRYFTRQDLRELFSLDNPRYSSTQVQLQELHAKQRKSDTRLDEHIAFLHSLDIFGISDHDLMFSVKESAQEAEEEEVMGSDYIQARVQKAQELIQTESQLHDQIQQQISQCPRGSEQNLELRQMLQPHLYKPKREDIQGPLAGPSKKSPSDLPPGGDFVDLTDFRDLNKDDEELEAELNQTMEELAIEEVDEEVLELAGLRPPKHTVKQELNSSPPMATPSKVMDVVKIEPSPSTYTPKRAPLTPTSRRTPVRHVTESPYRVQHEHILISPDAHQPLLKTKRLQGAEIVAQSPITLLDNINSAPNSATPSSRPASRVEILGNSYASPALVEESPDADRSRSYLQRPGSAMVILDSCENSPANASRNRTHDKACIVESDEEEEMEEDVIKDSEDEDDETPGGRNAHHNDSEECDIKDSEDEEEFVDNNRSIQGNEMDSAHDAVMASPGIPRDALSSEDEEEFVNNDRSIHDNEMDAAQDAIVASPGVPRDSLNSGTTGLAKQIIGGATEHSSHGSHITTPARNAGQTMDVNSPANMTMSGGRRSHHTAGRYQSLADSDVDSPAQVKRVKRQSLAGPDSDADSPIHTVKSKRSQRKIIESSDEEDENQSGADEGSDESFHSAAAATKSEDEEEEEENEEEEKQNEKKSTSRKANFIQEDEDEEDEENEEEEEENEEEEKQEKKSTSRKANFIQDDEEEDDDDYEEENENSLQEFIVDEEEDDEEEESESEGEEDQEEEEEEVDNEEGEDEEEDDEDEEDPFDSLSEEAKERYQKMVYKSRAHYKEGNIEKAYRYILHAVDIYAGDDRVNLYMLKLQQRLTT